MILCLFRVVGYQEKVTPILGSKIQTFKGNRNKATKDAKKWISENKKIIGVIEPAWKWFETDSELEKFNLQGKL